MTQPANNDEQFLEYLLRMTRNRIRLVDVGAAALVLLAAGVTLLLAIVVADHLAPGGLSADVRQWLRWTAAGVMGVLLAVTVIAPLVRRINDLYVARSIERANPAFRNELTAALQLDADADVDPALKAAIKRRARRQAANADVDAVISTRGLRVAAIFFAAAAGTLLLYALLSPKPLLPSLRRAMGNDRIAPPTATRIRDITPADNTRVITGRPVTFTAHIDHATGPATLHISRDGGTTVLPNDTLTMTPGNTEQIFNAQWTAAAADGTATFEITCGDARSPRRRLHVLPPPTLRDVTATIRWPDYTARPPSTSPGGDVSALPGSSVELTAIATLPLQSATLEFEKSKAALPVSVDGRRLTARFTVNGRDRYRIRYRLADDLGEAESIAWQVTPQADAPPTVTLQSPPEDITLPVNADLELLATADDDIGLVEILLLQQGTDDAFMSLARHAAPGVRHEDIHRTYSVRRFGQPGDVVVCHIQARDALPSDDLSGGQVGRSRSFTLHIAEPDRQLAQQRQAEADALRRAQLQTDGDNAANAHANTDDDAANDDTVQSPTQIEPAETAQTDAPNDTPPSLEDLLDVNPHDAQRLEELQQRLDQQPPHNDTAQQNDTPTTDDAGDGDRPEPSEQGNAPTGQDENTQGTSPSANQGSQQNDGAADEGANGQEATSSTGQGSQQGEGAEGADPASGQNGDGQHASGQGQTAGQGSAGNEAGNAPGQGQDGGVQEGRSDQGEGASQMHSNTGADGAMQDEERGEVDEVDAEAVRQTAAVRRLESLGRALDEAARQIRDDEVDPALLKDLNMTPQQFRNFVEEHRERYERVRRKRNGTARRETGEADAVGEEGLQAGRDAEMETVSRRQQGDEAGQDVRETRGRQVAPEYQKYLDAYFRDVNEE